MTSNPTSCLFVLGCDARQNQLLMSYFKAQGWVGFACCDPEEFFALIESNPPALLIMDANLSGHDSLAVDQRLRGLGYDLPMILVLEKSVHLAPVWGRVPRMRKPLRLHQLMLQIELMLPHLTEALKTQQAQPSMVHFGDYVFDLNRGVLQKNGQAIALTGGDRRMLHALVRQPGQVVTREDLSLLVRGKFLEPFDRSVDVQLSRLRKIIEEDARHPRYIRTAWGSGYVFALGEPSPKDPSAS